MGTYLLIESRDPFDSADVERMYELAAGLAEHADEVTVYLVQNGVMPVRAASPASARVRELAARATVLADDFSLRERGITDDEITEGVRPVPIEVLVDLLAEPGRKVMWH